MERSSTLAAAVRGKETTLRPVSRTSIGGKGGKVNLQLEY